MSKVNAQNRNPSEDLVVRLGHPLSYLVKIRPIKNQLDPNQQLMFHQQVKSCTAYNCFEKYDSVPILDRPTCLERS